MRLSLLIFIFLLLQACATERYIVDKKGIDHEQYQRDLNECIAYRREVNTTDGVAKSATAGAVVGAVIGAILGDSNSAGKLAGAGAVQAGTGKAIGNEHEKDKIVKNCLKGRGYKVLN